MARMRRIQVVIGSELDDRLEQEAAVRRMSKSALVRAAVERELTEPFDNGLRAIGALSPLFADIEPDDDIDEYIYGSLGSEA
jgi:hypothetical protein